MDAIGAEAGAGAGGAVENAVGGEDDALPRGHASTLDRELVRFWCAERRRLAAEDLEPAASADPHGWGVAATDPAEGGGGAVPARDGHGNAVVGAADLSEGLVHRLHDVP